MEPALVQEIGCAAVTEAFGQMESLVRSHLLASANTGSWAVKRLSMRCLRVAFGGTDRLGTARCGRDLSLGMCAGSKWFVCKQTRPCQGVSVLTDLLVVMACKESIHMCEYASAKLVGVVKATAGT